MRHTVHIMLGDRAERVLTEIKKYVILYGSEEENTFFNAMLYREDQDGAVFCAARPAEQDDSQFVAGIENLYSVALEPFYTVPQKNRTEYLQAAFTALYDRKITVTNPGDSAALHVCLYVPVYERKYWERVREFLAAMDAIPQQYEVDLFLLPYDLAFLWDDEPQTLPVKMAQYQQQTKLTIDEILAAKKSFRSLQHLILMQNCNADGLSLDLDQESLVRIIGEFALLTVAHYSEMFNPAAQEPTRPIHALGLSVLSLDKYRFVRYFLHKAYIHILDREKVTQTEVDVNKVSHIAQTVLEHNVQVFSRFYDSHVKPCLDRHMDQNDIIARIHPLLTDEMQRISDECQSFIDDPELSLPEKKATLAQLIGEDDDLLVGYMFNKKQLVIDDCSREVLDLFVEANNRLLQVEELIPDAALSTASGEELPMPGTLLDEIKATKVDMREASNYIRLKTNELQAIDERINEHEQSQKRLTDQGFVFDGQTFRIQSENIERPLEENYQPIGTPPAKADLRPFFTPVKNQGTLGACSAFALVAIYEYILRKNHQQNADLSEAFVYYNVRRKENALGSDPGSSLYNVVLSMGSDGVCAENLCPYTEDPHMPQPSEHAYYDALQRKIVKALNVRPDVRHIKAAVADGYPVAVSLKVFESFASESGFIPRPSDEEIQHGQSGYHAMVVCGYSDEEKVFIVRNSWGTKFGDRGYCYIPYSYFEDFLAVACVVTQINDAGLHVKGNDSKVTVSFDMSDARIKTAILRNLIDEEKHHLARLETVLQSKEIAYHKIFQALGNNANRTALCDGTLRRLQIERDDHLDTKERLQTERSEQLRLYRKETLTTRIRFALSFLAFLVYFAVLFVLTPSSLNPLTPSFLNPSTWWVCALFAIDIAWFILWNWRRRRGYIDLNEDYLSRITAEEQAIRQRTQQLAVFKLQTHVAGMIIDSLALLFHRLHSKYNGMRSLLANLKAWREEEANLQSSISNLQSPIFLSLLKDACLDRYFETCKEHITANIRLDRMVCDTYHVEEAEIIRFQNSLKQTLVRELIALLADFSICRHITGETTYDYVERDYTNLDELLQQMDRQSEPFVRTRSAAQTVESRNANCKLLFIDTDFQTNRVKWKAICDRNFQLAPNLCRDASPYKLTLLQLNALAPSEIALLHP